ncbi:MAG: AAA family ATPase [Clostridia bacterium]|nr:AAA family ATPase [Bacteroidales bacterium]MBR1654764.1 AAA family ATPase [Clostridia bacterium]
MKYTRKDYESFLNTELEKQLKEYEQLVCKKARILKEQGEIFVGMFIKFQPNGMAIFKVRNSENMPRKNSFWTASFLVEKMGNFKYWGDNSWSDLHRNYQRSASDALCVWIQQSEEKDFCFIGIKNLTMEFAQLLETGKTIIAFGPQEPPLKYLQNLIDIVRDTSCVEYQNILDYDETPNQWNPKKIEADTDFTTILLNDTDSNNCVVIQGPPGTGKTYRMAQLTSKLLENNKSVLVTALTNQALMELAKKEDMKIFLEKGRVSKTSLTVDENRELEHLQSIKNNLCNATQGNLSLATFYLSSSWAINTIEKPFDFVIMDEASQALLPMIAATMKLGKKVILIGDQKQLSPIVLTNEDFINERQWSSIVKGFETVCNNFSFKSYMLCDTFRLTKRGAESTGIFYNNELRSVSQTQIIPSNLTVFNKNGGPIFVGLDLDLGSKAPINAFDYILDLVYKIITESPKTEIAILSKFKETVRQLQKYFVIKWKLPNNIRIETVDRIQGLTVDYCFYLIPNTSLYYSLENKLFNVATSRARFSTIVVADKSILNKNMTEEVRKYLLKAQEDKFAIFEPKTISTDNIKLKIIDKIDLSQFERKIPKTEKDNKHTYIIDTNVFVNCPDIISRIGNKNKIIIPAKVLEELDKLKRKSDIDKQSLNNVAKNINEAFTKHYSKMEEANLSLLPKDFDKQNPDCMILSVALKYKNNNPILLTSDNILQSRASGLEIQTLSLKDFLKVNKR